MDDSYGGQVVVGAFVGLNNRTLGHVVGAEVLAGDHVLMAETNVVTVVEFEGDVMWSGVGEDPSFVANLAVMRSDQNHGTVADFRLVVHGLLGRAASHEGFGSLRQVLDLLNQVHPSQSPNAERRHCYGDDDDT